MKIVAALLTFALLLKQQVKGAAEGVQDSLRSIPEEEFEKFQELQTALFRSSRLDQGVVESTLQSHHELISNLNQAMNFLLDKIDFMQDQLITMEERLQQANSKADDALEKYQSCITSIKFGPMEYSPIYRGPGYSDEKSYVITGVENDSNAEPDTAHRRRYQFYRNGTWMDPVWE